jgi:hypothetical protein
VHAKNKVSFLTKFSNPLFISQRPSYGTCVCAPIEKRIAAKITEVQNKLHEQFVADKTSVEQRIVGIRAELADEVETRTKGYSLPSFYHIITYSTHRQYYDSNRRWLMELHGMIWYGIVVWMQFVVK